MKTTKFSPVVVLEVGKSQFQREGTLTAHLRVEKTTNYTGGNINNSIDDKIFEEASFNVTPISSHTSKRDYFLTVPESMDTVEKVQEHLKNFPDLHIFVIVSNKPILTKEDEIVIESGYLTLEKKANSQVIKNEKGEIILRDGKPLFKRNCLSKVFREDEDITDTDPDNTFITQEIIDSPKA